MKKRTVGLVLTLVLSFGLSAVAYAGPEGGGAVDPPVRVDPNRPFSSMCQAVE